MGDKESCAVTAWASRPGIVGVGVEDPNEAPPHIVRWSDGPDALYLSGADAIVEHHLDVARARTTEPKE